MTEPSDEAVEAVAYELVKEDFGGSLYLRPGGWEEFKNDRPNDLSRYGRRAFDVLAAALPIERERFFKEVRAALLTDPALWGNGQKPAGRKDVELGLDRIEAALGKRR